jgi:hypothetical protein
LARIQLYVAQSVRTPEEAARDSRGRLVRLPFLRLSCVAHVGDLQAPVRECLIDTGAPLTVVPRKCWIEFERHIEWLTPVNADRERCWLTNLRGWTGGQRYCRLGRVVFRAKDMESPPRALADVQVLAQFEEGEGPEDRIVVGLHASILQSRRLIVVPDLSDASLEDA